jgi:hypothetical protein
MKRTILTTAAFAAVILLVPAASAQDTGDYRSVGSGDWDTVGTWEYWDGDSWETPGSAPSASTYVTIQAGDQVDIAAEDSNALADHITVESTGTLNVEAGRTLTVDGSDNSVSSVDGTINLEGSGSKLVITTNNHTLVGGGSIDGQNAAAAIEIATNMTLTNTAAITGNLLITPVSEATGTTFINNGVVHANNAGTLYIGPDSIGVSSGVWQVSTSESAVLQIDASSANSHSGSVNVFNGLLDVDNDFATTGNLTFTGGSIDVQGYQAVPETPARTFSAS